MSLQTNEVADLVKAYQAHPSDTGSPEVQIAILTTRINQLTEHFKIHNKDFAGRRGLLNLVSQRRSLLDYLKKKNEGRYTTLIGKLNIRK
jgi:small subunit ribosomal protein S15